MTSLQPLAPSLLTHSRFEEDMELSDAERPLDGGNDIDIDIDLMPSDPQDQQIIDNDFILEDAASDVGGDQYASHEHDQPMIDDDSVHEQQRTTEFASTSNIVNIVSGGSNSPSFGQPYTFPKGDTLDPTSHPSDEAIHGTSSEALDSVPGLQAPNANSSASEAQVLTTDAPGDDLLVQDSHLDSTDQNIDISQATDSALLDGSYQEGPFEDQEGIDETHQTDTYNEEGSHERVSPTAESSIVDTAADQLHPVIIHYLNNELCLFPPFGEGLPDTFLLSDESVASRHIDYLFESFKTVLGESIVDGDELEIEVEEMDLRIGEDSVHARAITLSQILNLHVRLSQLDGVEFPEPLYMTLRTKPSFAKKISELDAAAAEGKGLSQLSFWAGGNAEPNEADIPEEDNSDHYDEHSHEEPHGDAVEDSGAPLHLDEQDQNGDKTEADLSPTGNQAATAREQSAGPPSQNSEVLVKETQDGTPSVVESSAPEVSAEKSSTSGLENVQKASPTTAVDEGDDDLIDYYDEEEENVQNGSSSANGPNFEPKGHPELANLHGQVEDSNSDRQPFVDDDGATPVLTEGESTGAATEEVENYNEQNEDYENEHFDEEYDESEVYLDDGGQEDVFAREAEGGETANGGLSGTTHESYLSGEAPHSLLVASPESGVGYGAGDQEGAYHIDLERDVNIGQHYNVDDEEDYSESEASVENHQPSWVNTAGIYNDPNEGQNVEIFENEESYFVGVEGHAEGGVLLAEGEEFADAIENETTGSVGQFAAESAESENVLEEQADEIYFNDSEPEDEDANGGTSLPESEQQAAKPAGLMSSSKRARSDADEISYDDDDQASKRVRSG